MNYPIEKRKIKIETLTPVFIGSGEKVDSSEYWVENGQLYLCNKSLLEQSLDEKSLEEYSRLILQIAEQKQTGERVENQINLDSGFLKKHPVLKKLLKQKSSKFSLNVEQKAMSNSPQPNRQINNIRFQNAHRIHDSFARSPGQTNFTGEVSPFMNNPQGFYIPGSSIKGALRQMVLKSMLIQNKRDTLNEKIEDEMLRGFGTNENRMLTDFFRVLEVADSIQIKDDSFQVLTARKESRLDESKRKNRPMPIHVLALKVNVQVETSITLNHQLLSTFKSHVKKLPFNSLEEMIEMIGKTAQHELTEMHRNFSSISQQLKPSKDENNVPNFFLGGHTGFERHTLWNSSSNLRRTSKEKPPTTISVYKRSNDLYSFGWCRLSVVD